MHMGSNDSQEFSTELQFLNCVVYINRLLDQLIIWGNVVVAGLSVEIVGILATHKNGLTVRHKQS